MRWVPRSYRDDEWRTWFAWLPELASVGPEGMSMGFKADPDKHRWVWLEWIERQRRIGADGPWYWYRLPQ